MSRRSNAVVAGRYAACLLLSQCLLVVPGAHAAGEGGEAVRPGSDLQIEASRDSVVRPAPREGDERPLLNENSRLRKEARVIKQGPEFAPEEVRFILARKKEEKPETQTTPEWMKSLAKFFKALAEFSRVLIWIGGAIVILLLLFGLHYWWRKTAPGRVRAAGNLPTQVGGLDIRPESLPDDVAAAALAAWRRGDRAQAMSLLYRGALSALVLRHAAQIRASSTEQECIRAARKVLRGEAADTFARLTQARLLGIYAQRWPSDEAAESLCSEYSQHFRQVGPDPVEPAGDLRRTA